MISHNYCYSTCLGSVKEGWANGRKKIGVAEVRLCTAYLSRDAGPEELRSKVFVSPNGVAFLKRQVRQGIIPMVLDEFLKKRIETKEEAKRHKDNKYLKKTLEYRQLALKLFMNVMYGYTGAGFSGRMPNVDISDSVVETGKYILQQCVERIRVHYKDCTVVYGDTGRV